MAVQNEEQKRTFQIHALETGNQDLLLSEYDLKRRNAVNTISKAFRRWKMRQKWRNLVMELLYTSLMNSKISYERKQAANVELIESNSPSCSPSFSPSMPKAKPKSISFQRKMEIKNRLKRVRYKLRFCSKTLAAKDLDQIISDNQASKTKNMKKLISSNCNNISNLPKLHEYIDSVFSLLPRHQKTIAVRQSIIYLQENNSTTTMENIHSFIKKIWASFKIQKAYKKRLSLKRSK